MSPGAPSETSCLKGVAADALMHVNMMDAAQLMNNKVGLLCSTLHTSRTRGNTDVRHHKL